MTPEGQYVKPPRKEMAYGALIGYEKFAILGPTFPIAFIIYYIIYIKLHYSIVPFAFITPPKKKKKTARGVSKARLCILSMYMDLSRWVGISMPG